MSLTAANFAANLATARRNVAAQLGVDPANLDYAQRVNFNRALASYVLQYPASFSAGTLETARRIAATSYPELADTSFQWGEFAEHTAAAAPVVLGGFTNKLLWILAAGVVVFAFAKGRKPSGPSPVPAA